MDNVVSQQISHDSEAEKAVLGAVFLNPEAIIDASDVLQPDDFYEHANRIVLQAMLNISDREEVIDPVTLQDELKKNNQVNDIGGIAYIMELSMVTPAAAHLACYVKIVKRKAILRNLISISQRIIQNAIEGSDDVADILDDAKNQIMGVSQDNASGEFKSIHNVLNTTVEKTNSIPDDGNAVTGLPSGLSELDKMTIGFYDNRLIILVTRPDVSKIAFALNVAQFVGLKTDKTIAMFSLGIGAEQLVQRMLASKGLIDSQHLRTDQLTGEEWCKLIVAAGSLDNMNIYIDDTPGIKMGEIRAKARRLAKEKGDLGLIVVDYLQLIEGPRSESRQQEVSAISRQLKKSAKELYIPTIALSQLSCPVEQCQDKRPVLSDTRESGSIEQGTDIVTFLYRDDYYRGGRDEDDKGRVEAEENNDGVEVIIGKNRSGTRGTVKLMFSKPYNRFSNLDCAHSGA